ncbi:MAG: hypothetical protein MZV63_56085 [Marinilabiliales bacterium]|nr:hypothetical protein [Marinilabiliales bacterium]
MNVTLTANDGNGNIVNCNFNVNFEDQTPPVLTSALQIVLSPDPDQKAVMPNYTVGVATDNCGVTVTQSLIAGTQYTGDQDGERHAHCQRWQREHCQLQL